MSTDYMKTQEEAEQLCASISDILQVKANINKTMEHHEDRADEPQYFVCIPYFPRQGKYMKEYSYHVIHSPEEWQAFQEFILRSAQFLGYERMEKDHSFTDYPEDHPNILSKRAGYHKPESLEQKQKDVILKTVGHFD